MKKTSRRSNDRKIEDVFTFSGRPYMNELDYQEKEAPEHLRFMSPDRYIELCSKMMGVPVERLIGTRLDDKISFSKIEQAASEGLLTIPHIDYTRKRQDGIHRALWAKEQGMNEIPVFIYR